MSDSIIMTNKRGSGVECAGKEPVFKMSLKVDENDTKFSTYHFIATDLSWGEAEATAVTQTVGGDLFMYCTGAQPITLTLTGMIIYPACEEATKKFRDFWKSYRIGTYKKLLELSLDEQVYYVALTSYTRQPSSSESDVDIARMTFIGTTSK